MRLGLLLLLFVVCVIAQDRIDLGQTSLVGGRDDALNRACMDHLLINMPPPDRHNDNVTDNFLTSTVDLALQARADHFLGGSRAFECVYGLRAAVCFHERTT